MTGKVTSDQVLRLLSTHHDGPSSSFAAAMRAELEAMPPETVLDITRGSMTPSLHHIYSVRRKHLGERGVDVRGIDAFLASIQQSPEGTQIGFIVIKNANANIIGICDGDIHELLGWAVVPLDLPPLDEFRSSSPPIAP